MINLSIYWGGWEFGHREWAKNSTTISHWREYCQSISGIHYQNYVRCIYMLFLPNECDRKPMYRMKLQELIW